jgi:hypothetical protein
VLTDAESVTRTLLNNSYKIKANRDPRPVSNVLMSAFRQIAVGGVLLTLLLVVSAVIYSNRLERSAEKVIRISYELSQGKFRPTLEDLQQYFGTGLKQSAVCTASGCGYAVTLSNRVLSELGLVPYTALRSAFWVRDNMLEENVLEIWTGSRRGRMVLVYVDAKYCDGCDNFDVSPCTGRTASVASGSVRIGYRSALLNKRAAFAVNTECFNSLGGCASIAELLPTVWHATSTGTLECAAFDQRNSNP